MLAKQRRHSSKLMSRLRTAALAAIGLSALAVGQASATDVDFWTLFTGPDGAAIDQLVKTFNATDGAKAGVNVKLLIIPWDDFNAKLASSIAARKPPALTIVNSDQVPVYGKQGALNPFTDTDLATAGIQKDDYIKQAWDAGAYKDKQLGIPIDMFPRHLIYNKALFKQAGLDPEKPPTTGDELLADAKKISALGNGTYGAWFGLTGASTFRNFYSIYWQYADSLYNADNTALSPEFPDAAKKALTVFKTLMDAGVVPKQDLQDVGKTFAQGKIGIEFDQITDLNLYQAAAKDQGVEFGVAPFPQYGAKPATFAMAHEFLIPRGTPAEQTKADLVFIKWLGEHGVDWAKTGKVPAQNSVIASADFKALPEQAAIAAANAQVHFPASIPNQPAVDRVVQQSLEAFFAGRADIDKTVADMSAKIPAALGH
jgi:multiple sugar transport system substrate-binding protein